MRKWCLASLLAALVATAQADDVNKDAKNDGKKADAPVSYQVPFRLTEVKHIMVRARINGKGPYNFIVDTGAPALFVSTALAKKLGVASDKDGWGTFDRFEIEGGAVVEKAEGKIADPFQLEGMNRMGLAGVELHGVIGYNVLARFKIELDFSRDQMVWTRLKFDPPRPEGLEGKAPGGVDAMAGLAKIMSILMGKRPTREINPRGFIGIETAEKDGAVTVASVLKDSPAAAAGLQVGDKVTQFAGKNVKSDAELLRAAAGLTSGESIKINIQRGSESREVTVQVGKGL
jgi:serine protease DegQ